MSEVQSPAALLEVRNLRVQIAGQSASFPVVDNVSFLIPRGQVVALVGESGCGKSITALSILRLLPRPAARIAGGQIFWEKATKPRSDEATKDKEIDLLQLTDQEMRSVRGREIAMIFQEPMTALNPVFSVGEQIAEVLILHRRMSNKEARNEAAGLLLQVGIDQPQARLRDYPHQFSGGMRQRVLIAMALACQPRLLIADEPTTALDVTVQAQILDLLSELQSKTGMSILLITHDLGVVAQQADYVYVMYAGRIVEHATTAQLFQNPFHPYTQGLLQCTPRLEDSALMTAVPGSVPDPAAFPTGCRFHPRCALSSDRACESSRQSLNLPEGGKTLRRCVENFDGEPSGVPPLREATQQHFVACWEA